MINVDEMQQKYGLMSEQELEEEEDEDEEDEEDDEHSKVVVISNVPVPSYSAVHTQPGVHSPRELSYSTEQTPLMPL